MKTKKTLSKILITTVATSFALAPLASASTINWVSWTPSASPGTTSTGSGSSLTVSANWTVRTNLAFQNRTINLTDASWPFTNQDVVHMWLSQAGTVPYVNATIDFTNIGGLAAGGAIGFVDIDNTLTSFAVSAYVLDGVDYVPQAVNWTFINFKNNPADPVPTWNSSNNTITGGGVGNDVFSFLTTDVRVDRIVLNGQTVNDGWGFAASSTSVIPEPSSFALLAVGAGLLALRRRAVKKAAQNS